MPVRTTTSEHSRWAIKRSNTFWQQYTLNRATWTLITILASFTGQFVKKKKRERKKNIKRQIELNVEHFFIICFLLIIQMILSIIDWIEFIFNYIHVWRIYIRDILLLEKFKFNFLDKWKVYDFSEFFSFFFLFTNSRSRFLINFNIDTRMIQKRISCFQRDSFNVLYASFVKIGIFQINISVKCYN